MALLDRATESRVMQIVNAVVSSFSVFALGRELGQTIPQAASASLGITTAGRLTFLESSYLAGKVATAIGTDTLRTMTEPQLVSFITNNNIVLTEADRVTINAMKENTERWLQGRTAAWQAKMRAEIAVADQAWRATIASTTFDNAGALAVARNTALVNLVNRVEDSSAEWAADVDRLVQSEMNNFFQEAQTADLSGEEIVYKQPRVSACPHCLRICVKPDGSFRRFKLKDVAGNSNIGRKAAQWVFTIGPIHPYCYCVLYRESDVSKGPHRSLARAKRQSLHKGLKKNSCGIPDDPDLLFEDQKGDPKHSHRPAHVNVLINAVKKAYGDSLPRAPED